MEHDYNQKGGVLMTTVELHSIPQTGGTKYEIVKYEGPVAVSRVLLTKRQMRQLADSIRLEGF